MSDDNQMFDEPTPGTFEALPASIPDAIEQTRAGWPAVAVDEFANSCDQLVRHLFDTSLRIHVRSTEIEGPGAVDSELYAVLDHLDRLIIDSSTVMLALLRPATDGPPGGHDKEEGRSR